MRLSRQEAIESLLETESMVMHGYSTKVIRMLPDADLCKLINEIFEPIDLEDPYTVCVKPPQVPASLGVGYTKLI
jgi:hypothetical protein